MEVVVAGMEYVPAILVLWEELAEYHERLSPFYERCEGALGNFDTYIRQCIESPNSLVFVCLDQGQVIGYANCSIELHPPVIACREYGFIVEMVVPEPPAQGRGDPPVPARSRLVCLSGHRPRRAQRVR
jgi:hypothetical protein